jgi:hypothetical protein
MYSRSLRKETVIQMDDKSTIVADLELKIFTDDSNNEDDRAVVGLNCSNIMILTVLLQEAIARYFEGKIIKYGEDETEDPSES